METESKQTIKKETFRGFIPYSIFCTSEKFNENDYLYDIYENRILETDLPSSQDSFQDLEYFHDESQDSRYFKHSEHSEDEILKRTPFLMQYWIPLFLILLVEKSELPREKLSLFIREAYEFDPSFSGVFFFRLIRKISYHILDVKEPEIEGLKRCYISDFLSCFSQYSPLSPTENEHLTLIHKKMHFIFDRDTDFIFIAHRNCSWMTKDHFETKPPFFFLTKQPLSTNFTLNETLLPVETVTDFIVAEQFDAFHHDFDLSKFPPGLDYSILPILPRRLSRLYFDIIIQLSFFFEKPDLFLSYPFYRFSHPSSDSSSDDAFLFHKMGLIQSQLFEALYTKLKLFFSLDTEEILITYLRNLSPELLPTITSDLESIFLFLDFFLPFSSFLKNKTQMPINPKHFSHCLIGNFLLNLDPSNNVDNNVDNTKIN